MVLFCWLLLGGLGSLAARPVKRSSLTLYALVSVLLAIWPLFQLIMIRYFREILFSHGVAPGFYAIFFYILITTAPYCFMVGFVLPYALKVLQDLRRPFTSGGLYITDNIGDITGGVLFSFLLVYWLKPFKTLAVTSTLLLIIGLLLLLRIERRMAFMCCLGLSGLFYLVAVNAHLETATLSKQYGDIARYVESPYGRIVVTREGPQHTLWESGVPIYSTADVVGSEEKVHYPLSQLEEVESVLLVSGGLGETLGEVRKYGPRGVDYVELDPNLTGLAQEVGIMEPLPFVSIINTDGRRHIRTTAKRYDAVIMDLPEPDTFQVNRMYTREFFSLVKRVLKKGGVFCFGLDYSPNYLSEEGKRKLSSLFNSLRTDFANVLVLPGEKAYFISRDGPLWTDIPARLEARSIPTAYVRGFYYGNVTEERIRWLRESLDPEEFINTDFEPRIMNIVFQEWFLKHGSSPRVLLGVLSALTLLYLVFMKREEYVLFSTGLATMGVEMLVVFTFQVMYGYIYLKIGAIITAFLLGLLPGAVLGNLFEHRSGTSLVFSELALTSMLLLFFAWFSFSRSELHQIWFLSYCFSFSFFCGFQFPAAAKVIGEERGPAAGCLAADLMGASLGTLVTGTLLIPLWGIQATILFLILVKISSNIIILFGKRRGLGA
ncbi:MAG: hypothetical protein JW821_01145 [Deltaproteobacteria bacterium]|nr:hypothetical protein [Deltaproteobacteria bacterium]